jgi:hypothetical protein
MKILKSYESFSGNPISFEEIKGIIDDILIDLKDINDNFSWKVVIQKKTGSTDNKYILDIFCHDDVSKIKGWVEVLDHLFGVLINEDLKIYSLQDLYNREVKPGNINLKWVPKHIISPMTMEYEDAYWQKSFLIMTY